MATTYSRGGAQPATFDKNVWPCTWNL